MVDLIHDITIPIAASVASTGVGFLSVFYGLKLLERLEKRKNAHHDLMGALPVVVIGMASGWTTCAGYFLYKKGWKTVVAMAMVQIFPFLVGLLRKRGLYYIVVDVVQFYISLFGALLPKK